MRKFSIIALVVCLMASLAGSAFAADVYNTVFTAGVQFTATGTFTCAANLVNNDGTGSPTSITWSGVDPSVATTNWKMADQCIRIVSTISTSGGIEIYTDNTNLNLANPRFTGDTTIPGVSAGGLVAVEDPSASPLPMCWRITDAPQTSFQPDQGAAAGYPDRIYDVSLGTSYPCYLWMEDASASNFNVASTMGYRVVKDERGIQHAEAGFLPGIASPDYVYVGAKFTNAISPRTYRTNRIIINAYTE